MTFQDAAKGLFEQAVKLPLHLFADDDKKLLERYDSLHRNLPDNLPEKRFFRH